MALSERLAQYTSRLLWHQLEIREANKFSVDRIRNLEFTLATFRKILRLGRCVDVCYTALNHIHHEDKWLRLTLTLSKLGHALYLYADHIAFLTRIGFLKTDMHKWTKTANKFWLVSIIANLAKDFYELLQVLNIKKTTFMRPSELINNSCTNFDMNSALKHLYWLVRYHKNIFFDTVKDSCDLFIPMTAIGLTKLSPTTVGFLGAVSSLVALYTIVDNICDSRISKG